MIYCPLVSISDARERVFAVFLLEPERTQFDLSWSMFGTRVRVHPTFWLFSAILGWDWLSLGFVYLLLWIGCTFLSILVHEFGHVFVGRLFGSQPHVILYSFGGLAVGSNNLLRRWQRIAVCLAGPGAGLLLFGLVVVLLHYIFPHLNPEWDLRLLLIALLMLWWMNLVWSLLNLVPIWPLDGGQVSREMLSGLFPGRGLQLSLGISFLLAAVLAIHSLMAANGRPLIPFLPIGSVFSAILFGLLAFQSFQLLQQIEANRRHWHHDDSTPWERDPTIWRR
jgi:Zn-dependent protease